MVGAKESYGWSGNALYFTTPASDDRLDLEVHRRWLGGSSHSEVVSFQEVFSLQNPLCSTDLMTETLASYQDSGGARSPQVRWVSAANNNTDCPASEDGAVRSEQFTIKGIYGMQPYEHSDGSTYLFILALMQGTGNGTNERILIYRIQG